jgi:mercuric reductase
MSSTVDKDLVPDFVPPKHLQTMHRAILHHFIKAGQFPTAADLAIILALPPAEIETKLTELAAMCLYRDTVNGEILGAYPFSARPTAHRLHLLNGQEVYAMCAVDALGVSAMLEQPVSIYSHCAHCDEPISLEVRGETLATAHPSSVVVWYQAASANCVPATAKCPGINFYCNPTHRVAWSEGHPDSTGYELTLAEALMRGVKIFSLLLRE